MDAKRMSLPASASAILPPWAMGLSLSAHIAVGVALGLFYFGSIRRTVQGFTAGGRVTTVIAIMIVRFAVLGGLLALASLEGALPLLTMALGVFVARFAVMRSAGAIAP
jgi:F1F0 ATPase subunit 2